MKIIRELWALAGRIFRGGAALSRLGVDLVPEPPRFFCEEELREKPFAQKVSWNNFVRENRASYEIDGTALLKLWKELFSKDSLEWREAKEKMGQITPIYAELEVDLLKQLTDRAENYDQRGMGERAAFLRGLANFQNYHANATECGFFWSKLKKMAQKHIGQEIETRKIITHRYEAWTDFNEIFREAWGAQHYAKYVDNSKRNRKATDAFLLRRGTPAHLLGLD